MQIGIPAEVKNHEYRVAMTPAGVHTLVGHGHEVLVEAGAGVGSGISDTDFEGAGARVVPTAADAWSAEMVCKVKEPVESEYGLLRRDQVLFTFLHLAASRPCTEALLSAGTTSIAYETVETPDGGLPLLAPMSEVAGRLATQVARDPRIHLVGYGPSASTIGANRAGAAAARELTGFLGLEKSTST